MTAWGKLALLGAFVLVLSTSHQMSTLATAMVAVTVGLCMGLPRWKLPIMAASGVAYFCLRPFRTQQQMELVERAYPGEWLLLETLTLPIYVPVAGIFLAACYGCLLLVRRYPASALARRSLLTQIAVFVVLLAGAMAAPTQSLASSVLWSLVAIMAGSFFFVAYQMSEARAKPDVPASQRLGFVRPFWGGWSIPFKGPSYLLKFEAKSESELAAVRLRALKLGVWAAMLAAAHIFIEWLAYDLGGLPTLQDAIAQTARGDGPGRALAWLVLVKTFLLIVLWSGALMHTLVAVVRMCGYGIPRGMARPLSARSIAEFWNRYLFYFKELLVDFFFYTAFVRFFKRHPRLRIAFATFSAAFVGNLLFSIISQPQLFAEKGVIGALMTFDSYAIYALALTIALIASQLRGRKPRPEDGFWRYEVTPRAGVIAFFCLALVFSDESAQTTLAERSTYMLYLFGA